MTLAMSMVMGVIGHANDLQVSTPVLDPIGQTISFRISWRNSWNISSAPSNWDAVWLFVKRQNCLDGLWNHALLGTNSSDHVVNGGMLQVDAVADGLGVFIRRATIGQGDIPNITVTLRMQETVGAAENFKVFGIEMVNIPEGNFMIGDFTGGWASSNFFTQWITAARQAAGMGSVWNYVPANNSWGATADLPPSFPLGYHRFYCMKYEVSQEQYADFLNTLSFSQQVARTQVSPASPVGTYAMVPLGTLQRSRSGIRIGTSGASSSIPAVYGCDLNGNGVFNEGADGQNIACNWLSWRDLTAYLDWAALRPMTEFEFEKVCRGPVMSVPGECAWGTAVHTAVNAGSLDHPGQAGEVSFITANGLCATGSTNLSHGPLRCGFAATASTGRITAGASYYGVMEMTGNVWEQCVGGWNYNYSVFTTANGDGTLSALGTANVVGWPPIGGGTAGTMLRGCAWNRTENRSVSARGEVVQGHAHSANIGRDRSVGGRGIRNW